jgi:hypothetical protein
VTLTSTPAWSNRGARHEGDQEAASSQYQRLIGKAWTDQVIGLRWAEVHPINLSSVISNGAVD